MLLRLLLPRSWIFTKSNVLVFVNPAYSETHGLWNSSWNHMLKIRYIFYGKKDLSSSLKWGGKLKNLSRTPAKNNDKSYTCIRWGRLVPLSYGQRLTVNSCNKCIKCKDVMGTLQRIIQRRLNKSTLLSRTALGSALFMPTIFFKETPQAERKTIPSQIPKVTKELKKKSLFMQLFSNVYEYARLLLRGLRLLVTFIPVVTLYPTTYLGEKPSDMWWGLLLKAIEISGPIMIKFGQWISTRHDLLPDSACRQFSRLQRRIEPHSWSFTQYRMKKAFGPNWRKIFVKFDNDKKPVGSGCVAQVYKVWMSKDAIPDQELLDEMISDLEDDNSIFEGFHVHGLGNIFGYGSDEDKVDQQAIEDWKQCAKEQNESGKDSKSLVAEPDGESSRTMKIDLPAVTKSVVNGIIGGEGFHSLNLVAEIDESNANANIDAEEHCLVEAWSDADLDKSLPVEETPPNDSDGLIPVAVKVLHPSVESSFRRDFTILRACASFLTFIYPPIRWLALPQCIDEFADVMSGQINLRKEADNLELFSENFAEIPSIRFPRPLRPYVTQKVIVETYEDGEMMSEFIGISGEDKPTNLRVQLAEIGVDALLKMIFVDNLVHGDMHPGNMLIQNISTTENGQEVKSTRDVTRVMMVDVGCDTFVMDVQPDPNPLRICLLDCGLVAKLKEKDLHNFKAVFKQVVLGNGGQVADLFLENSDHSCNDPEAFKTEMAALVENARQNVISLAQIDIGILLQQVFGTLLKHQVRLESAFSAVVLAVFVLEGLGRTLDPNMDILERARPLIVR